MSSHTSTGRTSWRCCICGEVLRFHPHDEEHVGFFAVHHLHRRHGMSREDVLDYDSSLENALREYGCCNVPREGRREALGHSTQARTKHL